LINDLRCNSLAWRTGKSFAVIGKFYRLNGERNPRLRPYQGNNGKPDPCGTGLDLSCLVRRLGAELMGRVPPHHAGDQRLRHVGVAQPRYGIPGARRIVMRVHVVIEPGGEDRRQRMAKRCCSDEGGVARGRPPANGPPPPPGTAGCASRYLIFSKNGPCEVHSGFHRPGVACTAAVIPSRSSSAHSGS